MDDYDLYRLTTLVTWGFPKPVSSQEDRVTPSYYTQGSHPGVSLEYMVRLSNEVGADPWFSVPINATDDYIQNFVQYVSDAWTEDDRSSPEWQRPISAPDFRQELLVHLGTLNFILKSRVHFWLLLVKPNFTINTRG